VRERRAFSLLALAALVALVRLALPVAVGLFLGAILGFVLEPLYGRLRKRDVQAGPAALACTLGATAIIATTAVAVTTLLVTRGMSMLFALRVQIAPGGALRSFSEAQLARMNSLHVNVADVTERLENEVVSMGSRAAELAADLAGITFGGLLTLFFMALATYSVLRHWTDIVARVERVLPFERRHTHALLEEFRTVGREVLLGTVVTGLAQGVLAAIGYWVAGIREPAFFGALTALGSLIPGVGTLLVWVPIGVVRILTHHATSGLVELAYSALIVGIVSDYVIRPRLVGRRRNVPPILMFVALFGGVQVFGIIGLILGPVLVTLCVAVLRTYEKEIAGKPLS
jgi:predicted PurR-regulated permease PerM